QRPGLVQAGRVDEHDLRVRTVHDAADRVPRGLGTRRRDGDLLPDQGVGQGGLARVRPADQRGEPAAHASGRPSVRRRGSVAHPPDSPSRPAIRASPVGSRLRREPPLRRARGIGEAPGTGETPSTGETPDDETLTPPPTARPEASAGGTEPRPARPGRPGPRCRRDPGRPRGPPPAGRAREGRPGRSPPPRPPERRRRWTPPSRPPVEAPT